MNKNVAVTVALVLVVGVGGVFGGMTFQKSQTQSTGMGQFGGPGGGPGFGGPGGYGGMRNGMNRQGMGRPVSGKIIEKDDNSITVKMDDGSTKIVMVPSSSTVNKASKATKEDLKVGENVMVMGTTNSDGSVSATNINLGEFNFGRIPGAQNGQNNQNGLPTGQSQGQGQSQ